ncbi:winged helix-turn-helix domain-containing protein [Pyrodictium abyssi]|uniref:ArnR1-like winged helix-turn-helix domain-containing protein n=1 Tax=Pyrodictium abyssi TaxID=54256 RepID=A0ABM8J0I5_9CREN|nr:hypothetical protein PABY_18860 [Pyrodictium abyssi]
MKYVRKGSVASRRDRVGIVASILRVLDEHGPSTKTAIMRLAEINSRSFEEYVERFLVPRGLVEKRRFRDHYIYAITPQGKMIQAVLDVVKDLVHRDEPEYVKMLRDLVAEALRLRGYTVTAQIPLGGGLVLPVDIAATRNGTTVVVNVAGTRSSVLLRLAVSALAVILGGAKAVVAIPSTIAELKDLALVANTTAGMKVVVYTPSTVHEAVDEVIDAIETDSQNNIHAQHAQEEDLRTPPVCQQSRPASVENTTMDTGGATPRRITIA